MVCKKEKVLTLILSTTRTSPPLHVHTILVSWASYQYVHVYVVLMHISVCTCSIDQATHSSSNFNYQTLHPSLIHVPRTLSAFQ